LSFSSFTFSLLSVFFSSLFCFSNYRFKLLYRAIDTANDGYVSREDFKNFILPTISKSTSIAALMKQHDTHGNQALLPSTDGDEPKEPPALVLPSMYEAGDIQTGKEDNHEEETETREPLLTSEQEYVAHHHGRKADFSFSRKPEDDEELMTLALDSDVPK
jgi:hypothetical protein